MSDVLPDNFRTLTRAALCAPVFVSYGARCEQDRRSFSPFPCSDLKGRCRATNGAPAQGSSPAMAPSRTKGKL